MKKSVFLFLTLLFLSQKSLAQCAMCKAVVESNEAGATLASGLNAGIVYLMMFPYLLIAGVAFVVYKSRQQKRLNTD